LQVAAFTGAGGVSFALVLMNLGFAACAHRLYFETDLKGFRKRSQEMLFGFFGLMVCLSIHVQEAVNRFQFHEPVAKVGFVQPNVPQEIKWNPENGPAIVRTLQQATQTVANRDADVILWPEAVTPWAIVGGDPTVRQFVEHTASVAETPIMLGSIAIEPAPTGDTEERWLNGAFVVDPEKGLDPNYYAKRKLVPFGEYVPMRGLLGWLEKVVPVGGDFEPGDSASPLLFFADDEIYSAAPLICYEDTFPALARQSMIANPDLFIVFTNNGWFGEGGAAEQHAAHSVLRAVETRRPVLRIGNAGWSGWIDEFGVVRAVLRKVNRERTDGSIRQVVSTKVDDVEGTIYFRGSATVEVERDSRWVGRRSFYLRHGDWFIVACAGLVLFGWFMIKAGQTLLLARRDP
jgi:apolipoprotein N-acyltransferase